MLIVNFFPCHLVLTTVLTYSGQVSILQVTTPAVSRIEDSLCGIGSQAGHYETAKCNVLSSGYVGKRPSDEPSEGRTLQTEQFSSCAGIHSSAIPILTVG